MNKKSKHRGARDNGMTHERGEIASAWPMQAEEQMSLLGDAPAVDEPSIEADAAVIEADARELDVAPMPAPEPIVASEVPEFASAPAVVHTEGPSLGSRLKRAREAQGMSLDDVSRKLRIPSARLAELEADAYDRISAPIYLRGYLKSYAKLLGMPEVVVTHALESMTTRAPALVATQTVSRSSYMASRYGTPLVYAVVTAVVIVPVLWAAYEGSLLPAGKPRLEPLDSAGLEIARPVAPAVVASSAQVAVDPQMGPPEAPVAASAAPSVDERRPVMAAMTAIPSTNYAEPAPKAPAAVATTGQQVVLTLEQPSWIELIDATGKRIEYGLLPAGTTRTYTVAGLASLRIGNTRGARVTLDGQAVDLAPHTRSNVARLSVGRPVQGQ